MVVISGNNKSKYKSYSGYNSKKKKKKLVLSPTTTRAGSSSSNSLDTIDNLTQQTTNYATRLEAINADGKDTRNPLEKLLNLPEDQNFLFDIGEILDRPFNAIKGGIQEAQEGGSFLEGLGSGISGEQTYYAGDILRNAGLSDDALFTNPLNGEDVSAADILGLGADIFADPLTYIPGGAIAKGLNVSSKAGKVARATKALNKATDALSTLQKADTAIDTLSDAEKALNAIKIGRATDRLSDATRTLNNAQAALQLAKNAPTPSMSLMDAATSSLGRGLGRVAETGDNLLTRGLEKLDNRTLDNLLKRGADSETLQNAASLLDNYKGIKKSTQRTLNYAKSLPNNLVGRVKGSSNALEGAETTIAHRFQNLKDSIDNYSKTTKNFKNADEIDTAIEELTALNKNKGTDITKIMNDAVSSGRKRYSFTGTKESINNVVNTLNNNEQFAKSGIKLITKNTNDANELTLVFDNLGNNEAKKALSNFAKNKNISETLKDVKVTKASKLTDAQKAALSRYRNIYNSDPEFKRIYDEANNILNDYSDVLYVSSGGKVDYNTITSRPGYFRKALNNDKYTYNPKAYGTGKKGKYTDYSVWEANNINETNRINKLNAKQAELDRSMKNFSTDRRARISTELEDIQSELSKRKDLAAKVEKMTDGTITSEELSQMSKSTDKLERRIAKSYLSNERIATGIKNKDTLLDNATVSLKGSPERVNARINKALDNVSDTTRKKMNLVSRQTKGTQKFNRLTQSNNDLISKLEKRANNLQIEFENWDPSLSSVAKYDSDLSKKINKLQDDIDLLKSQEGQDLFKASFVGGLEDHIKASTEISDDLMRYNDVLLEAGLNDDSIMKFIDKGNLNAKIPSGFKKISKEEAQKMVSYLNSYRQLLPEKSQEYLNLFADNLKNSRGILVDDAAYDLLRINKDINKGNMSAIGNLMNSLNNTFKKVSTLSPGFQVRNVTGNMSNQLLSGMPFHNLVSEYKHADDLLKQDNMWKLLTKATDPTKTLSKAEKADVSLLKDFISAGFLGNGAKVKDLQDLVDKVQKGTKYDGNVKKVIDKVFSANVKANEWLDAHARLATLSYAKKNPGYVSKLGVNSPIDAVKYVLFDPNNLSPFERNVAKKVIPFYTFTKQNLMFQMSNVFKNSSKYKELVKAFDETYDSLDDTQYRDYQKNSLQIPLFTDENGNLLTLKSNLPASDLGEWVDDPIRKLVSSASPFITTPYEMATGVDVFTGQESNDTSVDYLANMLGLANMSKVPGRLMSISPDNTASQNLSNLFGSVFSYNDADKIAMSNAYEEAQSYQDYINELKSQGINVPTLAELREQGIDVDAIREQIANDDSALRRLKRARDRIQKSLGN